MAVNTDTAPNPVTVADTSNSSWLRMDSFPRFISGLHLGQPLKIIPNWTIRLRSFAKEAYMLPLAQDVPLHQAHLEEFCHFMSSRTLP